MVKAILFDLTDTLEIFDWDKYWEIVLPLIEGEAGKVIDHDELKEEYQNVYEDYRLGKIDNDSQFFDILLSRFGVSRSPEQLQNLAVAHLESREEFVSLPEKFEETLKELKKHFKLAITSSGVSNWCYYDFENIFKIDLDDYFDVIIFSQEKGFLKETGKLFELAQQEFGLEPGEAAFVGNDYQGDAKPAGKAGLKTVLIGDTGSDFEIEGFSELTKIQLDLKEA